MKIKSLRLRIALMTSLLIALSCLVMMVLLGNSGLRRIDEIKRSLDRVEINENSSTSSANVEPDESASSVDVGPSGSAASDDAGPAGSAVSDAPVYAGPAESFVPEDTGDNEQLTIVIDEARVRFTLNNLYITLAVTLTSGLIAYFVSGRALKPLENFSSQVARVQINNLEDMHLDTDTLVEFQAMAKSFNDMLDRLQASYAAQKQFTGNAAHELRTPLSLLQMRLEVFEADHPDLDPESKELVSSLNEQIDGLSATLKTLLEMSNLQNVPTNEKVDLLPMLEEVATDLAPLAEKKGIGLEIHGPDIELTGSDTLLSRLFYNLTENAIKYGRPQGSVSIRTEKKDSLAIVHIKDTGYGIPKDHEKDIFQAFYRLASPENRHEKGVGLGLALAEQICLLHRGRVEVEESGPSGTTMAVFLPIR